MIQETYALSSEALDQLLSHFFDEDVFDVIRPRFTQPEVMKWAALSAFLYCYRYNGNNIQALKLELRFLEKNSILAYAYIGH